MTTEQREPLCKRSVLVLMRCRSRIRRLRWRLCHGMHCRGTRVLNEAAGIPVGDDGLPAPDYNCHSCGSFFMNPILTADQAAALPEDAPKFDATLPDPPITSPKSTC